VVLGIKPFFSIRCDESLRFTLEYKIYLTHFIFGQMTKRIKAVRYFSRISGLDGAPFAMGVGCWQVDELDLSLPPIFS
jgi:hypothetical protein